MPRTRSSRRRRQDISPTHPDAAAIDIGVTMHVAAVGPGRDPEPVRSFGTFTGDLQRLADCFAECGIRTAAMESTGVYWIPAHRMELKGESMRRITARRAATTETLDAGRPS